MDDLVKIALAGLFFLIGSHLLLWAWLKRKIDAVKREMESEKKVGNAADSGGEDNTR